MNLIQTNSALNPLGQSQTCFEPPWEGGEDRNLCDSSRSLGQDSCRANIWSIPSTNISLASFLWDIGKQNSPRCDAAKRGVPSGAILFADIIFIEK